MIIFRRIICLLLAMLDIYLYPNTNKHFFINKANIELHVNACEEYQEITGFGASACWWSQNCGNSEYADEVAQKLYSKDGLALNVYRYNIGAGEKDNPNSRIGRWRATESFYYLNEETGEYEYDFSRDAAAQNMLDKCLALGCIDTVVLFANSPHFSMTVSGQASGGLEDYVSNLPPENYEAYADYFLTITRYFLDKGVPVKYISPVNEPQWSWGGGWVSQEGCHYEKDELIELYRVFARKIKASGLDVKLSGPESGQLGWLNDEYFADMYKDPEIREVLGNFSYHSYWIDGNLKIKSDFGDLVTREYSDMEIIMSEWCELPCTHAIDDFEGAMIMAKTIYSDIVESNANSWSAWVGVNDYGINAEGKKISDGLLVANQSFTELSTAMRYYALKHYSRFIPDGSVRIGVSNAIKDGYGNWDAGTYQQYLYYSAYKTPEGKYVIVAINEGEDRKLSINIPHVVTKMKVVTSTAEEQFKTVVDGCIKRYIDMPQNSIITVVLD
ncbi:MAG TPA: glycoside hydrolase family 30 protein [Clostridiales bacterium]|nr:glycoside hydrolase family 30 protein [Clostridiales bacterium]